MINIFVEFLSHTVIEDLLFLWEPTHLAISWYVLCLPKWCVWGCGGEGGERGMGGGESGGNFRKRYFLQKILISKRGCIMGQLNFLKGGGGGATFKGN